MRMPSVALALQTVYDEYGEETLQRLLELAPLVAGSGSAWQFAVEAISQGDDGILIVNIPGLPGEPPQVTWIGSGWHVVAEPDGTEHTNMHFLAPDRAKA